MTKPQFVVDTNVFLRFLLKDVKSQYQQAERFFRQAKSGKIKLIVPQIVIFGWRLHLRNTTSLAKKKLLINYEQLLPQNI